MKTQQFFKKIQQRYSQTELKQIKKAYNFATKCHANQFRESKEPYITHPLKVADFLINLNLDSTTIIAALLHDSIEDTNTTLENIKKEFGNKIAKLVAGVTKLKNVPYKHETKKYSSENMRRMFLAMAQDIRVVLIKLADRHHNMATLNYKEPKKRIAKARETLDIYAPLANRLCMGELKGQLEDYAFPILMPQEYQWVKNLAQYEIEKRKKYIEIVKNDGLKFIYPKVEFNDWNNFLEIIHSIGTEVNIKD